MTRPRSASPRLDLLHASAREGGAGPSLLITSGDIADGDTLRTDVCIIGAGAAGISMARDLARHGVDCILLEAGGFEATEESQSLYAGKVTGNWLPRKQQAYLSYSRQRFFGGTTNHWAGWCRPFVEADLARRAWLPGSGWPISLAELKPWYAAAAPILDIRPQPEPSAWSGRKRRPLSLGEDPEMVTRIYQYSTPTRFGVKYREQLVTEPRVRLVLGANVTRLVASDDGGRVDHCGVKTLDGRSYRVVASRFVLAAGGIENARILLLSEDHNRKGLGNSHDNVGRYFCDHLETGWRVGHAGVFVALDPKLVDDLDFHAMYGERAPDPVVEGVRTLGVLAPTARACERERCLPFQFELRDLGQTDPTKAGQELLEFRRALYPGPRKSRDRTPPFPGVSVLNVRAVPAMTRANRVVLTNERDALGLPQAELRWAVQPLDRHTHRAAFGILARTLGANGIGRIQQNMDLDAPRPFHSTQGGMHHMCTTRMSADPRAGVVDRDCRVHGVGNLFVAGSSVFAFPGEANPTWTIVALALRLAAHLRRA